jgi:hypothetical protein
MLVDEKIIIGGRALKLLSDQAYQLSAPVKASS